MSGANTVDFNHLMMSSQHSLAENITNLWSSWDSARIGAKSRWRETLQFKYATSTRETVNGSVGGLSEDAPDESGQAGWSHSTHIPKLTEISDNLSATYMSAVYPNEDFFKFVGNDTASVRKDTRDLVESYLKSKHRSSRLRDVIQQLTDDFVDYGNCFAGVTYVREVTLPTLEDKSVKIGYSGPRVYRISPMDIVFNPLATSFAESPKIIRSIKTVGELIRDAEECPTLGYSREAITKARECRQAVRQMDTKVFDKHVQMTFDGYGTASQYFTSGFVELLEFYGDLYDAATDTFYKNHVITVMDRNWVLRVQPLDTWSGRPHIYHAGWRKRQDNLWAMGPLDNLVGMQFLINHLENARADAFDQMLAPTRVEVGDVERVDVQPGKPGGTYRIATGEGQVYNLIPDTTVLTADNQIMLKMEQMEQFAGLPKQELGIRTPGEKTFGEVMHLHRAASKVFKNKILSLETLLEQILAAELELAKTYMDAEDIVDSTDENGVQTFLSISPRDIKVNGVLVPQGASNYERRTQMLQNFQLFQQMVAQDPLALQHFSSTRLAQVYSEIMDLDRLNVVFPFVRVGEEAELQKLQQAAQTQTQEDDMVDLSDDVGVPGE